MTVNGGLTLAGTTVMKLNGSTNDVLWVTNTLTFGGTLTVTNTGSALVAGSSFKLFNKPGAGSFSSLNLPSLNSRLGWTNRLNFDGSIGVVQLTSTQAVNLAPAGIAVQPSGTDLTLNWAADHVGWHLQVQTNRLGMGLGTDWWDIIGSETTNRWIFPIVTTNPSVFFRLNYP